ncbi:hypothetical protein KZZ52_25515 [Dactylosporangium sp. AC04546]|uniref:hypothetical protein n=1 Tax=Dactylosporangium sp. AC04546 TaxID=2862460 RepID=UPI001EDE3F61|nr:hypothetical protein [Dactylosporangium sp. AC04546]WVK88630.1 hypothetical protein KZZ52_25515 [Dactylosporangium sp. AC04546]
MEKLVPDWLPAVVGMVVSVGMGVFFYARTDLNAALATFAGLLGAIISLQVETMLQNARPARQMVSRREVTERLHRHAWLPAILDDLLNALEGIHPSIPQRYAQELSRKAFEDCREALRDLQRGRLIGVPTENDWLVLRLTEQVQHHLLATTVDSQELDWWFTGIGQRYVRAQAAAASRGVMIERVFIYREWSEQLALAVTQQHDLGIRTFRVDRQVLPVRLKLGVAIWDGSLALEMEFTEEGIYTTDSITFVPKDVDRVVGAFSMIRGYAEPWPATA